MKKKLSILLFTTALLFDVSGASTYSQDKIKETPDLVQSCKAANFNMNGDIYCCPVAVSDSLIWLSKKKLIPYNYTRPEDQYSLVKQLVKDKYLKTDFHKGTGVYSMTIGLQAFLIDLGVKDFTIQHSGWRQCKSEFNDKSKLTMKWIEENIKGNHVQWLNIGWYRKDKKHLYRVGGHWLAVVGFRGDKLYVLDPSPRNGENKVVHRLTISKTKNIALKGDTKGLPETSDSMLEIKNGFKFKRTADVCLIDSSVSLNINASNK